MDSSGSELSVKYSIGKISEIIILLNEMIFKLKKKVSDVSRDVETMKETPAVCTSNVTCGGDYHLGSIAPHRRKIFNRKMNVTTLPKRNKTIEDPHLRKLYQMLIDVEEIGRMKWIETFMYMSNYRRTLRPVAREEFYATKKFFQRQTLVLEGRNDSILPDNELTPIGNQFDKFRRREKTKRFIAVKNLEFEGLKNEEATSYPPSISGTRRKGQK